jgi:hypothetical protein
MTHSLLLFQTEVHTDSMYLETGDVHQQGTKPLNNRADWTAHGSVVIEACATNRKVAG